MSLLNTLKKKTNSETEVGQACAQRCLRPKYEVKEEADSFAVSVELPGVAKGGLELSVADDVLEISGARSWSAKGDWRPLAGSGESDVSYRLRLDLGDQVDSSAISAELEQGILRIVLPKAEEKKPRRIAIA